MNENLVLNIVDISKKYKEFTLEKFSFSLPKGYIMGLVGPNGSGKTTTIKMILDLVHNDTGEVLVFGKNSKEYRTDILQNIGIVFDTHNFIDEWKPQDINKIYSWFYSLWNEEKFYRYLEIFEISNNKMVKEMSKGMQMKLMIACALSYDAKLLILDEPTSGLDPVSRDELIDILGRYVEDGEHSVLFSTHITGDLEKIADYITYLSKGKLVFSGEKHEFTDKYLKIKGSYSKIDDKTKKMIIGIRRYEENFEGLIETHNINVFDEFYTETVTIEDIVIFMGRKEHAKSMECY